MNQDESGDPVGSAELGALIGVSDRQVNRWTQRGIIPVHRTRGKALYSVDDVRLALIAVGWEGNQKARRLVERGTGTHCCSKCRKDLPDGEFPPSSFRIGAWWCRGCRTEAKRIARALAGATAIAVVRERSEARRAAKKVAIIRARELRIASRLTPAERLRRSVDRQRERYNTDPEYQAARKALKIRRKRAQNGTKVVAVNRELVAARDGWRCGICAGKVTRKTWSLDHIVPLSKGGSHTYVNVTLAHRSCNSRRGTGRLPVQAPLFAMPAGVP